VIIGLNEHTPFGRIGAELGKGVTAVVEAMQGENDGVRHGGRRPAAGEAVVVFDLTEVGHSAGRKKK
jgi:hypothetical protein